MRIAFEKQPTIFACSQERARLSGISIQCESRGGCGTARSRRTEVAGSRGREEMQEEDGRKGLHEAVEKR